ncbi:DoxX family protein [Streptomyces abyssalis]|uniref:DoxX family protein n=1 Tax=Streptomyces abyssalis TaxID=933944 RepID=A0A1E7JSC7_9ACTN|nr:DoxX family protein [Streptomyces abyssalis]OEU91790.1 DoxX family protein [Streptomyces abyssalis]OEU94071.1 DoxX family protein [Streptomyces abyssalis]OEV26619.1 DoxX family protein [Streptomyces nanshensis]
MNAALWTAQILLAALFLVSGVLKVSMPKDRLIASGQTGVAPFPLPVIRVTATCELFAVAGLLLPWLTGVAPSLTPLAAVGLAIVMVGALSSHSWLLRADRAAGRGNREAVNVAANVVVLALCVFVAAGRF